MRQRQNNQQESQMKRLAPMICQWILVGAATAIQEDPGVEQDQPAHWQERVKMRELSQAFRREALMTIADGRQASQLGLQRLVPWAVDLHRHLRGCRVLDPLSV
jgi:hypothetical protein